MSLHWDQLAQTRGGVWALAGGGCLAAVGAVTAWRKFRPRPDPAELERQRRLRVNQVGRLTGGEIVDLLDDLPAPPPGTPPQRVLVYRYQVRGVQYEASQDIAPLLGKIRPQGCTPGQPTEVKFDPANPGNSILVCESWCGLR